MSPSIRRGEAGLNFFLELELDFKQRTIFKLVRASYKHSRVSHRKTWCCAKIIDYVNHRSRRYLKKRLMEKLSNSPLLPSPFLFSYPHVSDYCEFIVRFIPSSHHRRRCTIKCSLRNCIARQQRLTRVNPCASRLCSTDLWSNERAQFSSPLLPSRGENIHGASLKRTE